MGILTDILLTVLCISQNAFLRAMLAFQGLLVEVNKRRDTKNKNTVSASVSQEPNTNMIYGELSGASQWRLVLIKYYAFIKAGKWGLRGKWVREIAIPLAVSTISCVALLGFYMHLLLLYSVSYKKA